jgi:hypothetical protein
MVLTSPRPAPIATTLDTYSHVLPVLHGQAIRVLDTWLCGARMTSHTS